MFENSLAKRCPQLSPQFVIMKTCQCRDFFFQNEKIENFTKKNYIFKIFTQNIDHEYTLKPPQPGSSEAILTRTHNLCSGPNFYFFFNSVLCPFQDYFSSYETGQSVGGAKTGEPREKPPGTPASRTWLVSHVARAGLEPAPNTAVRSSD